MTGVCQGLSTGLLLNDGTLLVMQLALQTKEAMMKWQGLIHWCLSRDVHERQTMIDSYHLNHYLGRINVLDQAI